jgi:hypothetical protein
MLFGGNVQLCPQAMLRQKQQANKTSAKTAKRRLILVDRRITFLFGFGFVRRAK